MLIRSARPDRLHTIYHKTSLDIHNPELSLSGLCPKASTTPPAILGICTRICGSAISYFRTQESKKDIHATVNIYLFLFQERKKKLSNRYFFSFSDLSVRVSLRFLEAGFALSTFLFWEKSSGPKCEGEVRANILRGSHRGGYENHSPWRG